MLRADRSAQLSDLIVERLKQPRLEFFDYLRKNETITVQIPVANMPEWHEQNVGVLGLRPVLLRVEKTGQPFYGHCHIIADHDADLAGGLRLSLAYPPNIEPLRLALRDGAIFTESSSNNSARNASVCSRKPVRRAQANSMSTCQG